MEQEEKIKLYLDSLCVYKGIFKEKVGDKFKTLVDKISIDSSFGECIVAYNEFTYSLFSVSEELSFKEGIVDEMLLNSNPFNVMVEASEEVAPFIIQGIKGELECLGKIALVNSTVIKEILISKFGENQVVKKRISSLLPWGINSTDYIAKNDTDFEKIKTLLINNTEWASCTDKLINFHKKNGTGRVTAYGAFVWERYE